MEILTRVYVEFSKSLDLPLNVILWFNLISSVIKYFFSLVIYVFSFFKLFVEYFNASDMPKILCTHSVPALTPFSCIPPVKKGPSFVLLFI